MTYQVLARKWRPQDFSAIIGQEPIVTALRNALREGRIAQAYLFAGIRGVGKTTAARVLAKALNCERGPAEDPCNECATCTGITSGSDLDVLEIDAATYSKVEQVRELTESLKYGPANDRYKVVVLDEVHRLSRQAFDALLKIVEEPPPHLTFIFATTEVDAVPATILSRCQEFHFRRVPAAILTEHLQTLCEAEDIQASKTALRLIARAGDGSVRDSVALLDQLATFGNGAIEDDEAVRLLGGLDTQLFERILGCVFDGDHAGISTIVREIEDRGWDPRSAFSQFLTYCRDGLHLASGSDKDSSGRDPEALGIELPRESAEALRDLVQRAGFENLLRLVHLLLNSELIIKRSELPGLALEVALLRAAELPKLQRLEDLLREPPAGKPSPPGGRTSDGKAGGAKASSESQRAAASTRAPSGTAARRAPNTPERERGSTGAEPRNSASPDVASFARALRKKPSLAAHLPQLRICVADGLIRVSLPSGDSLLPELFAGQSSFVEQCAAQSGASGVRFDEYREEAPHDPPAEPKGLDRPGDDLGEPTATETHDVPPASQSSRRSEGQSTARSNSRSRPREPAQGSPTKEVDVPVPPAVEALMEVFPGRIVQSEALSPPTSEKDGKATSAGTTESSAL